MRKWPIRQSRLQCDVTGFESAGWRVHTWPWYLFAVFNLFKWSADERSAIPKWKTFVLELDLFFELGLYFVRAWRRDATLTHALKPLTNTKWCWSRVDFLWNIIVYVATELYFFEVHWSDGWEKPVSLPKWKTMLWTRIIKRMLTASFFTQHH
jgi:hypothetical protein